MLKANDPSQFSEGAVTCRSFGHAWKAYTATAEGGTRARPSGWNVTLICNNGCGTFKHFMLSRRGEYGSPRYTYADGYLATFVVTPMDREKLRLEALAELLAHSTHTATPLKVVK